MAIKSEYEIKLEKENNKVSIYRAIKFSRDGESALSIQEIAEVITEAITEEERAALVKELLPF